MKYENLLSEKEKLEKLIRNEPVAGDEHQQLLQLKYKYYQLEQENKELKKTPSEPEEHHRSAPEPPKTVDKTFHEQVPVSADHYKIPIAIRNKNKVLGMREENFKASNSVDNFQMNEQMSQNVLQQPVPFLLNTKSFTTTTPSSVGKKEELQQPALKTSTKMKQRGLPRGL